MRTVVRSRWLVTSGEEDGLPRIIPEGAVVIEDGHVLEIGVFDELKSRFADAPVVGTGRDVVMPGFVNAHHHVGLTPLQLGSPDLALELWWISRLAARTVDLRLDTLYSAFEMIESGVTTVQHLHGRVGGPVDAMVGKAQNVIDAYREVGMRVSYSSAVRDQNRLLYQADETLLASLPPDLADGVQRILRAQHATMTDHANLVESLVSTYRGDERVAVQLAPGNLHWCSDDALEQLRALSERHDLPLHMHLDETKYQREYARKRTGGSAIAHLDRLGLLTERMTLGHGVWFTEDDIRRISRAGARICSNCSSNLRLRSGIAPLNAFAEAEVEVAVGIDEAGINDDRDMFQELRMMLRVHRTPGMDEDIPTPASVFRMATEHGANTTPFGRKIGALKPGRAADIVIVDWDALAYPYLDAAVAPIDALVQRARPGHVKLVMVAGEPIYRDGQFLKIDKAQILSDLAESLRRPLSELEESNAHVAKELMPYVRQFYRDYIPHPARKPFYVQNSR